MTEIRLARERFGLGEDAEVKQYLIDNSIPVRWKSMEPKKSSKEHRPKED
jgi:hypothetical protein